MSRYVGVRTKPRSPNAFPPVASRGRLRAVGDRSGVARPERRPPGRPEAGQRARELVEVQAVVAHPGGEEIEAAERAGPGMGHGQVEALGVERPEPGEARAAARPQRLERLARDRLEVPALDGPALGVDRRELRPALDDDTEPGPEIFRLLVAEMAQDLHGRPLRGDRTAPELPVVEIGEQGF